MNVLTLTAERLAAITTKQKEIRSHFGPIIGAIGQEVKTKPQAYLTTRTTAMQWLDAWHQMLLPQMTAHQELAAYEEKCRSKWFGPQGGSIGLDVTTALALENYEHVVDSLDFDFTDAINIYLETLTRNGVELHQLRTIDIRDTARFPLNHKSNSGIISWTDRRSLTAKSTLMGRVWYENPFKLDVAVIGSRYQRLKKRAIYMTSDWDLVIGNSVLTGPRAILKTRLPWHLSWTGQENVDKYVSAWLGENHSVFFEGDYKSMDLYASYALASKVVKPVLYALYAPGHEWLIDAYMEAVYHQPILISEYTMLTGMHNTISGTPPTNDWESIENAIGNIAFAMTTTVGDIRDYTAALASQKILQSDFDFLVLGDDVVAKWKGEAYQQHYNTYLRRSGTIAELFTLFVRKTMGLEANVDKQRESNKEFYYCKRLHSSSAKRYTTGEYGGIYPTTLALNSILNPEFGSNPDFGSEVIRILQIMDNCQFHPFFPLFVTFVWKRLSWRHILPDGKVEVTSLIEASREKFDDRDWKFISTGIAWSYDKSPAVQVLLQNNLLKI